MKLSGKFLFLSLMIILLADFNSCAIRKSESRSDLAVGDTGMVSYTIVINPRDQANAAKIRYLVNADHYVQLNTETDLKSDGKFIIIRFKATGSGFERLRNNLFDNDLGEFCFVKLDQ